MRHIRFLLAVLVIGFYPYAAVVGLLRRLCREWPRWAGWTVSDLMPVVVALIGLLLVERRLRGGTLVDALRRLGLGKPTWVMLLAGFFAGLPAWIGLSIALLRVDVVESVGDHVGLTIIRVLLAQALFEELLFRGFAFRCLARDLSYSRAALGAAAAFGLAHLGNLFSGPVTQDKIVEVGVQVLLTFALAFAPTALFWRSQGVIWGACLWHLMLDTNIFFPGATPDAAAVLPILLGALLTIPAARVASRLLLPTTRR